MKKVERIKIASGTIESAHFAKGDGWNKDDNK